VLDFQDILDKSHPSETYTLSGDSQALFYSALLSYYGRYQWLYGGDEPDDSQWNDIDAAISKAMLELMTPITPGGGTVDYELHLDQTLSSDAASVLLTDVDLLTGTDLILHVIGATDVTSRKHLKLQINDLTTNEYDYYTREWRSSVTYYANAAQDAFQMRDCLPNTNEANYWGYITVTMPLWKETAKKRVLRALWNGYGRNGDGSVHVNTTNAISKILLFPNTDNLRAGTRILLYSRG